jgi:transcriptional regulator with XRE-family HTH domain
MKYAEYLRRRKGWRQIDAAAASGVPRPVISGIEAGTVVPSERSTVLPRLARALGLPASQARRLLDDIGESDGPDALTPSVATRTRRLWRRPRS